MDLESFISQLANSFNNVTITEPTLGAVIAIILAGLLLMASGFVSASEIAFFSLSPNDLNLIDKEEHPSDNKIKILLEDQERLLATVLISNNFVNVTIIMLCNYFFAKVINFGNSQVLEFIFITVILTFLLLLFGEIMPKIYSSQHTLPFCRKAAPVIIVLKKIFRPLSNLLVHSSLIANKVISKENQSITVGDLEQALELTDKKEISDQQNMLQGIIRFGEETAKEIMTSRMDMMSLDMKTSFSDVLKFIVDNNYSRIPVYTDNIDNIKGILYIKDLLPHLNKGNNFRWQSLIRSAYFVPETKMIDDLLREFQINKIHIAIVVDEFGGTSGIVTMEDIIEEIVGEINDEYDDDNKQYVKLDNNNYIFEAKILLSDFCKVLKINDDTFKKVQGEADTLAGLLLELKGEFPKLHEKINNGIFTFEVLELNNRRILKVKVTIHSEETSDNKKS